MEMKSSFTASRRTILKTLAVGAVATPYLLRSSVSLAADPIVMVTWGGSYQDLLQKLVAEPFTQKTGIPVKLVGGPDLAKAKAQIMTGNLEWDIYDNGGPQIFAGEKENLWEPLDTNIVDTSGLAVPATKTAVPFFLYAGGIGYVPERKPKHPNSFAEFWDIKNFPGRRLLRDQPNQIMEAALLADGVSPAEMYPLDIERAFRSLDKIKPHVTRWSLQTPEAISLMQTNEIDFAFTYNGRVATAQQEGLNIQFVTNESIVMTEYFTVLRGSKRREQAMRFLAFALQPEIQTAFSNAYYSIPGRAKALAAVDDKVKNLLPDPKGPRTVVINEAWWTDNYVDLNRRFKEWVSS